jgi:hypothetical protein
MQIQTFCEDFKVFCNFFRFSTWENIDVRPPLFTGLKIKIYYKYGNVALIFKPCRYRKLAVATLW